MRAPSHDRRADADGARCLRPSQRRSTRQARPAPFVSKVAAPAVVAPRRRPSGRTSDERTKMDGRSGDVAAEGAADGHGAIIRGHEGAIRIHLGRLTSHASSDRASSVAVRYDARTAAGTSGAAVFETNDDGTSRRLVAMHRAGDPAASRDAEGLSIADIMRDVAEITAERAVQTGASAGNLRAAASELLLRESRGGRCRAAAAALRAAAEHPHHASRAACDLSGGRSDVHEGADAPLSGRKMERAFRDEVCSIRRRRRASGWFTRSSGARRTLALRNRRTPAGRAVEARQG